MIDNPVSTQKRSQLVIGLGTGRSGTTSLAKFLDAQPEAFFVHEGAFTHPFKYTVGHYLPWDVDHAALAAWHAGLHREKQTARFYGDVGSYFLPYVELLRARFPRVRFVCMKRDRAAVIDSFMHITPGVHSWNKSGSKVSIPDFWDAIHPDMGEADKATAIGKYWDMYYETAEHYARTYPDEFKIFVIDDLNHNTGREAILDFAGFPADARDPSVHIHTNKRYSRTMMALLRFTFNSLASLYTSITGKSITSFRK